MTSIKVQDKETYFIVYGDKKRLDKELKLIGAKFSSVLPDGPGWTVPKTSSKLLFKLVKYINEDDEVKDDKEIIEDKNDKDEEVKEVKEVKEEVVRIVNKQRIRSKDRRLNITREREKERQRELDILKEKEKGRKGKKNSSSSSDEDEESTSDGSSSSDSYPSPATPKRKIDAKDYKKLYNQVQSLQRKFERLR